ncbi:MAG TPA: HAMP domain-containing histidine kinase [Clostridiaceae bacterium]|nr:HAMP domain-containing histidine kinase [Clostridiaceae bacterium]
MKFRPQFMRSIYGRTIFKMAMFILAIFLILGTVYFAISNAANRNQQTEQLQRSAVEVSRIVSQGMSRDRLTIEDFHVTGYITFTGRAANAMVWVINQHGEIIYDTGIPLSTFEKLGQSADGERPLLNPSYLNGEQIVYARTAARTPLRDVLPKDQGWLVASSPLLSTTGAYAGEVMLIQSTIPLTWGAFLQSNAVPLSFLVAFFLSLIIIIWLSNQITRPISDLTKTAEKVYLGDLSARAGVDQEGLVPVLGEDDGDVDDDMMLLIRTFNTLIEKFEAREKERRDFLNSISHDLRTPITSVKGFVSGMLDGTIPEDRVMHYLTVVKTETDRVQQLINTLFNVVLSEDKSRLRPERFDLNHLMRDSLSGLEPQIREKNLEVSLSLLGDSDGRLDVIADEAAIMRVLTNLFINAIRFTPKGGQIAVESRRGPQNETVVVSVQDSGPGILPEDQGRIFDQFYKADKSRQSEGSGLGLYIARNLLAAHGQRIEAGKSSLGGAKFTFSLTLA